MDLFHKLFRKSIHAINAYTVIKEKPTMQLQQLFYLSLECNKVFCQKSWNRRFCNNVDFLIKKNLGSSGYGKCVHTTFPVTVFCRKTTLKQYFNNFTYIVTQFCPFFSLSHQQNLLSQPWVGCLNHIVTWQKFLLF